MPPKKAYESYDSESDGDNKNRKCSQGKKQKLDKDSDEYRMRRERNNLAVRKSREASRKKAKETVDRVKKLREENEALEQKVVILNKELGVLRDLFLTHASATTPGAKAATETKPVMAVDALEDYGSSENLSSAQAKSNTLVLDHKYVLNDK